MTPAACPGPGCRALALLSEAELEVTAIEAALVHGESLEAYPDDPRGESCLIVDYAGVKPIYTVYIPQPPKGYDPRTRGRRP